MSTQTQSHHVQSAAIATSVSASKSTFSPLRWYFLLILAAAVPTALLYVDISIAGNNVTEISFVEFGQEIALLGCIITFLRLAQRKPSDRVFSVLAAGLFACMFIRELDAFWDHVAKHVWKALVCAVLLPCALVAYRYWQDALGGTRRFLMSRAGILMAAGMAVLLIYSRLIGQGDLWLERFSEARGVKNAIEESSELLGYLIIVIASRLYLQERDGAVEHDANPSATHSKFPN